jgi:hypothetical protein
VIIHQAVYGYDEGHRLLRSSTAISGVAGRQLRGLSDASFEDADQRYLTVAPIPELRSHAVIRTWPALEAPRPGSVWSHVLLIDHVDLAAAERLNWLLELFARPPERPGDSFDEYAEPLQAPKARRKIAAADASDDLLVALASAVYVEPGEAVVQTVRACDVEPALIALWEQQWPRLRRAFSFRTRHRTAASKSVSFDLQVVERLGRGQNAHQHNQAASFLGVLTTDLAVPDARLRNYLREFGAQADRGRGDMGPLVNIYELSHASDPHPAVAAVCREYPTAAAMRTLKHALLGAASDSEGLWALGERERLEEILVAPPAALDLDDLNVGRRLQALWQKRRRDAVQLLRFIDDERSDPTPAETLVAESAFVHVDAYDASALARQNVALATRILSTRRDLLSAPPVWNDPVVRALATSIAADAGPEVRAAVFEDLLGEPVADGLEALVTIDPPLWWSALEAVAGKADSSDRVALIARLIDAVGTAAVGSPPSGSISPEARILLASATDPADGLWRQIDAKSWVQAAKQTPPPFRVRVLSICLAAATGAGSPDVRRRLWTTAFGPLHAALAAQRVDDDSWRLLDRTLPHIGGDDWDRCRRLRAGAIAVIKRDRWTAEAVANVVDTAGDSRAEMITALTPKKKSKKGWLRDLVDHIPHP